MQKRSWNTLTAEDVLKAIKRGCELSFRRNCSTRMVMKVLEESGGFEQAPSTITNELKNKRRGISENIFVLASILENKGVIKLSSPNKRGQNRWFSIVEELPTHVEHPKLEENTIPDSASLSCIRSSMKILNNVSFDLMDISTSPGNKVPIEKISEAIRHIRSASGVLEDLTK